MTEYTPERDASLGLVFRLNNLWAQTDYAVFANDYNKWDVVLDRIYCNLLYHGDLVVEEDGKKKILKVELTKKDTEVYNFLSRQIAKVKSLSKRAKNILERNKARSRWYHLLQKKDIWLRKKMMGLKLYLKEVKSTPGAAMFGEQRRKR